MDAHMSFTPVSESMHGGQNHCRCMSCQTGKNSFFQFPTGTRQSMPDHQHAAQDTVVPELNDVNVPMANDKFSSALSARTGITLTNNNHSESKPPKSKGLSKHEKERREVAKYPNDLGRPWECDRQGCKVRYTTLSSLNRHRDGDGHGPKVTIASNLEAANMERRNRFCRCHQKHDAMKLKALTRVSGK